MDRTAKATKPTGVPHGGWTVEPGRHRDQEVLLIRFPYDAGAVAQVRSLVGSRWSRTLKAWYVPDNAQYRQLFGLPPKTQGKQASARVAEANRPALQRLVETLRLKGYSTNTENTYRNEFVQLLQLLRDVPMDSLTPERLAVSRSGQTHLNSLIALGFVRHPSGSRSSLYRMYHAV